MGRDPSWFDRSELERLTADTSWRPSSRGAVRGRAGDEPAPRAEAAPAVPAFVAPQGGLEVRLTHLLAWAVAATGLEHAFVADERGLVLGEHGAGGLDPAIATAVDRFVTSLAAFVDDEPSGHVALQAGGRFVVLSWDQGAEGRYVLGLSGQHAPSIEALPELSLALADVLHE